MSSLTPLLDSLVASTLARRADPLPLKGAVDIAAAEPVIEVEPTVNDTRLASRAAIDRQTGAELLAQRDSGSARQPAPAAGAVRLSAAARLISDLLGPAPGAAGAVRGSAPVWNGSSAPTPQLLAPALARTVALSGLFYESHLAQFAAGWRPLSELAQEPQARLGSQAGPGVMPVAPAPASVPASSAAPLPVAAEIPAHPVEAGAARPEADGISGNPASDKPAVSEARDPVDPNPFQRPSPATVAAAYGNVGAHEPARQIEGEPQAHAANNPAPISAADAHPGQLAAALHPDAAALVRQQLELLAVPVFRWSGEVWPDAPMDWEIAGQEEDHPGAAGPEAAARVWSTRMKITLPKMGVIEMRMGLAGKDLQVHLAAVDEASLLALRKDGEDLQRRLAGAGLQLAALQVAPLPAEE